MRILPGVAVSLLVGNVYYGLQARRVARRDGNPRCTALPYGINTPSVFAYVLFIMGPVFREHRGSLGPDAAATLAWQTGLMACLVSGVIEFLGSFLAERLRRVTPRAALLGVLAAVGVAFIASDFAFRIFSRPVVAMVPMAILLLAYFSQYRFPMGFPGGFLAIVVGAVLAWGLSIPALADRVGETPLMSFSAVGESLGKAGWVLPTFCGGDVASVLERPELVFRFLTVSIPMGVLNVLGSLQNIESAEAGGDRFQTAPSLAVNGMGTIAAGLFGSCFPTTIYIGHPGWKALGARSSYSIANGVFFTACFLLGFGPLLRSLIPIEAGAAIVMYIGLVITAQAFQTTPREHAPAVAMAFFPAMAALLVVNLPLFLGEAEAGKTLADLLYASPGGGSVASLPGLVTLAGANSGWLVVTLILVAIGVGLIERRYTSAAIWSASAAGLTALGFLHSYRVEGNVIREYFIWQADSSAAGVAEYRAGGIVVGYAAAALLFAMAAHRQRSRERPIEREIN